ncbi:MAG: hypothetical protein J3Q66DRAFT_436460 [Benniella sp.]|nr:MAG: hypothetical protein J3Q66DRAFT_436460 [Benniella sp.]
MLATATLLTITTTTTTTTVWAAPSPFHSKRQNIGVTPTDPASAFASPPMDPASAFASPPMDPSALASGVNLPPSPPMNGPDLGAGPLPSSPSPSMPQILPQQDIQIASETNVVPTTGVFPKLIFQPAIQLFDPLVSSYPSFGSIMATGIQGSGLLPNPGPFMGAAGAVPFMGMLPGGDGGGGGGGIAAQSPLPSPGAVGGGGSPVGMFKKRQLESGLGGVAAGSIGATGAGRGIVGTPSGISTDMLIQPIVTIQPHALQPVPVPVSQPYSYPVPAN